MSGLVFIELRFLVEEISCDATTMFFFCFCMPQLYVMCIDKRWCKELTSWLTCRPRPSGLMVSDEASPPCNVRELHLQPSSPNTTNRRHTPDNLQVYNMEGAFVPPLSVQAASSSTGPICNKQRRRPICQVEQYDVFCGRPIAECRLLSHSTTKMWSSVTASSIRQCGSVCFVVSATKARGPAR